MAKTHANGAWPLWIAAAVLAAWSGAGAEDAQELAARQGGALPITPAAYAALPKLTRHRAWLPARVDLSGRFPKPGDQQWQGSCVAWATGYAARSFLNSPALGRAPQSPDELVSPEYIYNRIRRAPLTACFVPTQLTDALTLLQSEGAATMAEFPYDVHACQQEPPERLKASASRWRIRGWRAIDHETPDDWSTPLVLDDAKGALAQGLPVVFIMRSPQDFYDRKNDASIYRRAPRDNDEPKFHAMALVGYDDEKQAVRLINSWGDGWGDHGYAWVDYDTFRRMVTEAYVMQPAGDPSGAPLSPMVQAEGQRADAAAGAEAGLAELVRNPGCGSLKLTQANGRRVVEGYGGVERDLAYLKTKALALDPNLTWRVQTRPWPQCETELTLQKVLDGSALKLGVADDRGAPIAGDPVRLSQDQLFSIDVRTTPDKPFVHVIYLQADGSAVELYRAAPPVAADGQRRVLIGAEGPKAVRFKVAAPLGDEIVVALAATGPLFDQRLGQHVTERQFLTMLRRRLAEAGKQGIEIAGAVTRIHTAS